MFTSSAAPRFLRYVTYDTQSDENSKTYPSTDKQLVLLKQLVKELKEIGAVDASIDQYGYVMATIPATPRKEYVPTIGFIAHVDTSPEVSGAQVRPIDASTAPISFSSFTSCFKSTSCLSVLG